MCSHTSTSYVRTNHNRLFAASLVVCRNQLTAPTEPENRVGRLGQVRRRYQLEQLGGKCNPTFPASTLYIPSK